MPGTPPARVVPTATPILECSHDPPEVPLSADVPRSSREMSARTLRAGGSRASGACGCRRPAGLDGRPGAAGSPRTRPGRPAAAVPPGQNPCCRPRITSAPASGRGPWEETQDRRCQGLTRCRARIRSRDHTGTGSLAAARGSPRPDHSGVTLPGHRIITSADTAGRHSTARHRYQDAVLLTGLPSGSPRHHPRCPPHRHRPRRTYVVTPLSLAGVRLLRGRNALRADRRRPAARLRPGGIGTRGRSGLSRAAPAPFQGVRLACRKIPVPGTAPQEAAT